MFRYIVTFAMAGALALTGAGKPAVSTPGSYQVDARHSHAKLTTDGTTDFGKSKMPVVLGFARVNGDVVLNDADLTNSHVDLHIYPATAMSESIGEDGNFKTHWLANLANQTLLCFHSKQITKTADGKLQVTGELKLTRVDRNVQVDPSEAYSGPVYGPPVIHTVSRPATLVFDVTPDAAGTKDGVIQMRGTTAMTRESFPQLLRAVVSTYWPPLVQDQNCQLPSNGGSEDYRGAMCSGTVLQPPALPQGPYSGAREDYPGPGDYNAVSGNELSVVIHLRLVPAAPGGAVATGD